MITDEDDEILGRYRDASEDIPSPSLDRAVGAAISRQAAQYRYSRRVKELAVLTVLTGLTLGAVRHFHSHDDSREAAVAKEFGKTEGLSRYYLLQNESPEYAVDGVSEGAP